MKKPVCVFLLFSSLVFAEFPVTIIDDVGMSATIQKEPLKIISLAPSNTEILFALGLGKKVVGVTNNCDFPSSTKDKEKVGDFTAPNIEKILILKPDLVLSGGGVQKDLAIKLAALKIPTLTLYPKDLNQVLTDIVIIGKATGRVKESLVFMTKLTERINNIKNKTTDLKKPTVYFEIWNSPITSAGAGTFIDELIVLAGGQNLIHDIEKTYPEISAEEIIKRNPEIIVTAYMGKRGKIKKEIINRSGWKNIDAVKNDKIYDDINPDLLLRSGPRLVNGLEELAKKIHPEAFDEKSGKREKK